ncbi:unnamed protein product [Euphydryas editha]|uniref:Uncharacterized protein n=1 Tax=Euphydryas editha TaxID=104508 RepID=A0AAU9UKY4_EUPED|nr:unnamed protein product [Euphydryas editha]
MFPPSVPGSFTIPGYSSGRGNGGAEGAKNHWGTLGCQSIIQLATYNVRALRLDHHLTKLEVELSNIKWSVLGLSEVRRESEDSIILHSGHLLYYRKGDRLSQGSVGFLVHKTIANNVVEVSSVETSSVPSTQNH